MGFPNATAKELKKQFPVPKTITSEIIDPLITFGTEGLAALTTTKYSPQMRNILFEGGYIDSPDVITESAGMMVLRDTAGLLRLVVNPAMSGAENLGLIERTPAEQETQEGGLQEMLKAPRREYTESVESGDLIGMGEAYLKEVLVETATMRGLGNDISEVDSVLGVELKELPLVGPYMKDTLLVAGTVGEFMIPLPIGKSKAIATLGKPTKFVTKNFVSGLPIANQKHARMLSRTGEFGLDIIAGGGNPLFATVKLADEVIPSIAAKAPITMAAAADAKVLQKIGQGQPLANALSDTPRIRNTLFDEVTSVRAKVADQTSDIVQALEIQAKTGANGVELAANNGIINQRTAGIVEQMTPEQANKALEELVQSDTELLGPMAQNALERGVPVFDETGALDVNKMLDRRRELRGVALEETTKFGLDDYIMLTDRTIVSKKWMDNNFETDVQAKISQDGKSTVVEFIPDDTGRIRYKLLDKAQVEEIARVSDDSYLAELARKGELTTAESIYVTNRIIDRLALEASPSAFKASGARVLQEAAEPLERRRVISMDTLKQTYRSFTPVNIRKVVDAGIDRFGFKKPTNVAAQTAQTRASTQIFNTQVKEGTERLERSMKGAFGNVSRNYDFLSGLQAKLGMKVERSIFSSIFPQETLIKADPVKKQRGVYESVALLQAKRYSLAEISSMSQAQMKAALEAPLTQADKLRMQVFAKKYARLVLGPGARTNADVEAIINAIAIDGTKTATEAAEVAILTVLQRFPEFKLSKVVRSNDAMAAVMVNDEVNNIVKRALNETFATEPFAAQIQNTAQIATTTFGRAISEDTMRKLMEKLVTERIERGYNSINDMSFDAAEAFIDNMFDSQLKKAYKESGYDPRQFLSLVDGGASDQMANYLNVTAIKRNISPKDLVNNYQYRLRQIQFENQLGIERSIMYPMSAAEQDAINAITRQFGAMDTEVVTSNFAKVQRNRDIGEATQGMLNYYFNGLRRTFVSGQLGGKMLPNIAYQMENLLTANLITYVTNPKYWPTVVGQTIGSVFGLTPYRKLRYMAQAAPDSILPGTRFTYAQVYEEFTRRNLGVSQQGINLGDAFYDDIALEAAGWQRFTRGIPGYKQQPKNLFDVQGYRDYIGGMDQLKGVGSFARRAVGDVFAGASEIQRPLSPTMSPFMRWADETDRAFRESIFVAALQKGEGVDSAAKLAREVMLDYGVMPPAFRRGFGKMALYMSFTTLSTLELLRAFGTSGGALRVAAMTKYHLDLSRAMGTYYTQGDQTLQALAMRDVTEAYDSDQRIVETYMRSPYIGSLMAIGQATGFATSIATGRTEDTLTRAKEGISDFLYLPMIDFMRELDVDYKKGVPAKEFFKMREGIYGSQFFSLQPHTMLMFIMADGGNPYYYIDRYDIEVRPLEKRVPGSPTFDGQQYRFRSKAGYNQYLTDQLILGGAGIQRGFNDYYNALLRGGYITVPPNTELSYFGKDEAPLLTPMVDYLFLKKRAVRVPKDLEIEYRALKESERRLEKDLKKFEK